jgi:hypothetical protein
MHQDDFANVTVHDVDLGWHLKGRLESDPTARRGMLGHGLVMWSIYDIGLWIFGESPRRAIVEGWLIANAVIGILWSNVGPDPKSHTLSLKEIIIRDSVFIGRRQLARAPSRRESAVTSGVTTVKGSLEQRGPSAPTRRS